MIYLYQLQELCKTAQQKNQLLDFLGSPENPVSYRTLAKLVKFLGLSMPNCTEENRNRKYPLVIKTCPVCDNEFKASLGSKSEKTTCSSGCANTHFRSGEDHPNWIKDRGAAAKCNYKIYRIICFEHHKKECAVSFCTERIALDVHHMDEDHGNSSPENLIPLCRNHHFYWHSDRRSEIEEDIYEYVRLWKKNKCTI